MVCQSLIYVHGTILSDTYANISALATANNLRFDTLYQINDNTDAEGGDIILKPIATNKFSKYADYIPSFDTTQRWACIYDFENGEIDELRDNLGNIVIGNSAVNNFIWGNNDVNNNYIDSPTTLTLTAVGVLTDNRFGKDTVIIINGANSTITKNIVEQQSTFNVQDTANATISNNSVTENSTLLVTTNGGIVTRNRFSNGAYVDLANVGLAIDVQGNTVSDFAYLNIVNSTISFSGNSVLASSSVEIFDFLIGAAGEFYANVFNYALIYFDDINGGKFSENKITGESAIDIRNSTTMNVRNNSLDAKGGMTLVNVSGTVIGNSIRGNSTMRNAGVITITGSIIWNDLANDSDMNFTANHAGSFDYNYLRANTNATGGANAGINHMRCLLANSTHAFAAAVSENNFREND